MESLSWWHTIRFSPEVATLGRCDPSALTDAYLLDTIDFRGKDVLDIGCWDGFQSFYAEARGARRVVGIDDTSQRPDGAAAREFTKRKLRSGVEFVECNVYDVSLDRLGSFDIVMMFGVLYHLIHPMLGVEKACSVAKSDVLLASYVMLTDQSVPWCVLFPGRELCDDDSNWSGVNAAWVRAALDIQGFAVDREQPYNTNYRTFHARRTRNEHTENPMLNAFRDTRLFLR